ncbi:MAG: hypothetical protein HWD63_00015 [Candidatus Parvibacillus calidus]|nr:MAG: hypothetical protein HWD63_00015 [Candidatus Parvibacillus calidus]
MAANYIGLLIWVFVWMFDQAVCGEKRMAVAGALRAGATPTLMLFVLFLQKAEAVRGMKGSRIWFQIRRGMTGFPAVTLAPYALPAALSYDAHLRSSFF